MILVGKIKNFWNKSNKPGSLQNKTKIQISFPSMPLAISNGLIHGAYLKFYTDIVGLDITIAGLVYLVFGIWNAINDPLLGVFIDRFKFRKDRGKFTYLLRVSAPITVIASALMLFAQPGWAEWVIFLFFTVLLFIFDTTQTAFAIAHTSYILVAAASNEERLDVSVFQTYFGQAGAFMSMMIPTLVLVGDSLDRYVTIGIFSIVIVFNTILYYFALKPLKENEEMFKREIESEEGKLVSDLKEHAKDLMKSKSFKTYILYQIIGKGATIPLFTLLLYMADYVLGFTGIQTTLVDLIPGLIMFLFVPLIAKWAKRWGFRKLILYATIPLAISYMGLYWVKGFWITLIVYVFVIIFTNVANVVHSTALGSIIDEDEQKTGKRKAGLYNGINQLLTIPVGGLHTLMFTTILGIYGFVSGTETQSVRAQTGIRLATSFIPALFLILGMIPLFFFPITKEVEDQLSEFSEKMHRASDEENVLDSNSPRLEEI